MENNNYIGLIDGTKINIGKVPPAFRKEYIEDLNNKIKNKKSEQVNGVDNLEDGDNNA